MRNNEALAKQLLTRLDTMKGNRYSWENSWQDIIDYTMPNRMPINTSRMPGEYSDEYIYDSTAVKALIRLGAVLNGWLTNMSTQWFLIKMEDDELNDTPEVKMWLEQVQKVIRSQLENSNFYTEIHELYLDLASFGTGVFYIEERHKDGKHLNFSTRHIGEIFIAENMYGEVDTVFRVFDMTRRQMMEKWNVKSLPDDFKTKTQEEPDELHQIIHAVYPRTDYDNRKKTSKNLPYASVWIERENELILGEGGYNTFPYCVPRWIKSSGEKYGRSPALNSLGDIKTLNAMMYTLLDTGNKIANPPILVPDESLELVDLRPGGITYYDTRTGNKPEPFVIGANLPITFEMVAEKRNAILDAFFTSELQMIDNKEMTAEEVRARQQENARVLGPTFGRLQSEFIDKLIGRVLEILFVSIDDEGEPLLPQPPQKIQGKEIKLKYVSPLATSQKMSDVQKVVQGVNMVGQWSQIDQSVLDNLDLDATVRLLADLYDLPMEMLRTPEAVAEIRQGRYDAAVQQAQAQQQLIASESAKMATQAEKNQAAADEKREMINA
jgi:hypothetical protein